MGNFYNLVNFYGNISFFLNQPSHSKVTVAEVKVFNFSTEQTAHLSNHRLIMLYVFYRL